jgi:6-pyruvoyltetrahydropterin/6-carboxytetrahydropterin synthase
MNHAGKCRHLHGHSARVSIKLNTETLDANGMVCDFSDLKEYAEKWINDTLDHNFLMHKDDPLLPILQQQKERVMVVDEHPTAEYLAKLIFSYVKQGNFPVKEVAVWETESSQASYSE